MIWISSANAITDPFSPTSLANEHKTKSRSSSGYSGVPYRVQPAQHPQFRGTLQGTASTAPPINGNANVVSVRVVSVVILPDPSRSHFGPIMPTTLGNATPPRWTSPDFAKEQTDAARRRAQKTRS